MCHHRFQYVAFNAELLSSDPSSQTAFTTSMPAPVIVSAVASDPDNGDAVFGNADRIIITFDVATNIADG